MDCFKINIEGEEIQLTKEMLITFLQIKKITTLDQLKKLQFGGNAKIDRLSVFDKIQKAAREIQFDSADIPGNDYSYKDRLSVCNFIDAYDSIHWENKPKLGIRMMLDQEKFREYSTQALIDINEYTEDEANEYVEKQFKLWETEKEDGKLMHRILSDISVQPNRNALVSTDNNSNVRFLAFIKGRSYYKDLLKSFGLTEDDLQNREKYQIYTYKLTSLQNAVNIIFGKINTIMHGLRPETYEKSSAYSKHFSAKLSMMNKLIGCHIDQIYVDNTGHIHLFNFKMTNDDPKHWNKNKDTKYTYEMALIKRILAANGIPVEVMDQDGTIKNNISMYNIPVRLKYTEENDKFVIDGFVVPDHITYTVRDNEAYLHKFEKKVNSFIKSDLHYTEEIDLDANLDMVDQVLTAINPTYDAKAKGLQLSAKAWIREHYNSNDIKWNEIENKWEVHLDDNTVEYVSDSALPPVNNTILELVKNNLNIVQNGEAVVVNELVKEIINNYHTHSGFQNRRGFRFNSSYAELTFGRYLQYNADGEHDWTFVQNQDLFECGILMFRNKHTGQIDVVVPSSFRLTEHIPTTNGNSGILGSHVYDMDSPVQMDATYGNMELIRTVAIINEIIPQFSEEYKLGNIQVISPMNRGEGIVCDFRTIVGKYNKIIQYLKSKRSSLQDYKNNFKKDQFMDPILLLTTLYNQINNCSELTDVQKHTINSYGLEGFNNVKTKEAQILKLQELITNINERYHHQLLIRFLSSNNLYERTIGEIYKEAINAVNHYNGLYDLEVKSISSLERYVLPQYANPDKNLRYVANLYTRALDNAASTVLQKWSPIRDRILKFYDSVGYTKTDSAIYGSAESVYKKMFKTNAEGKNTWEFVNPYSMSSDLNNEERAFLKYALFQFAKLRAERLGYSFNFKSENDPKLIDYINEPSNSIWYFRVPLERASESHMLRNKGKNLVQHYKHEIKKMSGLGVTEYLKQKVSEIQSRDGFSDQNSSETSIYNLKLSNQIGQSVDNGDLRNRLLNQHEDSYWETNIEYLLIDCLERQTTKQKLSQVEFYAKCMLFQMELIGSMEGEATQRLLRRSSEEIEKYMKLHLYGKSIMETSSQVMMEALRPAKELMSKLFIAMNIRDAVRDTIAGGLANYSRTISKYQTDLTKESITFGYNVVTKELFTSDRTVNLVSELCLRYRLSNTDAARIADRAKTGRGGVYNPNHFMYSTLRGPDFVNRMSLFVARCKQDGVWEALDIDEETGSLTYDWTRDKRYSIYASGNTTDPEYLKQKSKYFTAVKVYNQEHPEAPITFDGKATPLPEPYSQNEIRQFKMFADNIYGAYDKSMRSLYEFIAVGQVFLPLTTWLNGQTAAYFRKPGTYSEYWTETDDNGNILVKKDPFSGNDLYFDNDGNIIEKTSEGKFIDEEGNELPYSDLYAPIIDRVPIPVQGIIYTLGKYIHHVFAGDGFNNAVWKNKYDRENFNKAAMDLLIWAILGLLFKFIFDPSYEDHKKEIKEKPVLESMLIELFYKAGRTVPDTFSGVIAIGNYILNDVDPSAPNVSIKVVKDGWKTLLGEKSLNYFLFSNIPVMRHFKTVAQKQLGQDF